MTYGFVWMAGIMMMMFQAFLNTTTNWTLVVLPFLMLTHLFQSNKAWLAAVALFVAVKVTLTVSAQVGGFGGSDVLFFAGAPLAFWGINVKCPRCRLHVAIHRYRWWNDPAPDFCNCCGRTRKRVQSLQYLFKPEAWDGEYHDEGGGPVPDDQGSEYRRYLMQQRWQRRTKKRG